MLQVVTLVLALASSQDSLTIKGDLKDVPAQGKERPILLCEGTTNLPNGVNLIAHLYYGKVHEGKELFKDSAIVKDGRFRQIFPVFARTNFPGTYIARLAYDSVLQGLNAPDYPRTAVDFVLKIGGPEDMDREGKVVRDQLIGEIRGILAITDKIKAKLDQWRDKTQDEREGPSKDWHERMLDIRKRADPRSHPEYYILRLDLMTDAMMENLSGILVSCARCFVLNQRENALEGLTRIRQTCEYWIGEVGSPGLQDFGKMADCAEECRTIARRLLENPDEPVLPVRRRFLELTALLDKSVPVDFHEVVLEIADRATAFFTAVSDKTPESKQIHAALDARLARLAASLRKN